MPASEASDKEASALESSILQTGPAELESGVPNANAKYQSGEHVVEWDGADDARNPMNWLSGKKWAHVVIVALLGLIPNMATTVCAPGLAYAVADLGITSTTVSTLAVTIYLLGLALGPLCFSSLSESYGRALVYHGSNLVFMAFLIGTASSQTTAQFMVCRFFSGCAGGMPLALGGGTIADVTSPAQRGLATALFSLGPLAGPVLGPVIGGFIAAGIGWRWTFWILVIIAGAVEVAALIIMRETSTKTILDRKAARLRKETGNPAIRSKFAGTLTPQQVLARALVQPTKLLITSPILLALSLYAALVFGVIYILFTTFDDVFEGQYGFSRSVSGLVYLGLGIALVLGVFLFGFLNPRIQTARMKADGVTQPRPEYRLILMIWFSPLVAVGLFIYGWSAQYKVQWIVPIIGTFFIGTGAYFVLMPTQLYLIELYGAKSAASALGAYNLLRYLGGTFLPLAGPRLYDALNLGWGNTLLGFLALAFVLAPIMFYRFGERLRGSESVKG